MGYNLKKFFKNFGGLNLSDSELLKDDTIATDLRNSKFGDNLSKIKRRGHKRDLSVDSVAGNGCITYVNRVVSGQSARTERIMVSDSLTRIIENQLNIAYSGIDFPSVSVEIVDGQFTLLLYIDGVAISSFDLGLLADTVSAPTISDLVIAINATPDFTAVASGDDTFANLLNVTDNINFNGSIDINYNTYEAIEYYGDVAPFDAHYTRKNEDDFELTDHIQARGCIYFTDIDSGLWKYDGVKTQKVPSFKTPDPTIVPAGGIEEYQYRLVYKFVDAIGNVTYSTPSDPVPVTGFPNTITLAPITQATSPYNLDNATQVILRTVDGGNTFFIIDERLITEASYIDSTVDNDLVDVYNLPQFTVPTTSRFAYIDIFRDQIVLTGSNDDVDKVVFEDLVDNDAYYELNSFVTESRDGGANSGIKSLDNTLYVFKSNSIFVVTGELDGLKYQVDTLSDEGIGCLSNKSLIEYNRRIWFLGRKGIYSVGGNSLKEESADISPLFQKELRKVATLRAFSLKWIEEDVLMINLPERINGNRFSNDSRTLTHHSKTGNWSVCDNYNFANGADNFEFKIWFDSDVVASNGDIEHEINTSLHTNSRLDYADNESPIKWVYASNWEAFGEPSVPKKYVRLKLYSIDTPLQNYEETKFTIDVTTQHEYEYETVSQTTLAFNEEVGGWGIDPWGFFGWGHIRSRTSRTRLQPKKTRSIRLILSNNNLYENVLLTGYEYEVAVEHDAYMRRGR